MIIFCKSVPTSILPAVVPSPTVIVFVKLPSDAFIVPEILAFVATKEPSVLTRKSAASILFCVLLIAPAQKLISSFVPAPVEIPKKLPDAVPAFKELASAVNPANFNVPSSSKSNMMSVLFLTCKGLSWFPRITWPEFVEPKVPEAAVRSPRKNASPVESIANCLPIIVPSLLN
jgi:hypothetical protein